MAAYQGGAAAFSYAGMGKAGHAADAATNTEETLTLGPTPTPSSSSSSLASLLLTQDGGRAGPAAVVVLTPQPGVGGGGSKARVMMMAPGEEPSVPSSEGDWLLAQHKRQQAHAPQPALKQDLGGGKALEDEAAGDAACEAMTAVTIASTSSSMHPQPRHHRRNGAEWLRAVHAAAFVGAEITAEEAAVLRSLAFGMGASEMVVEEC